jgi:hypothetical protein
MTGLTRASLDFEFAVLELIMLVHCHQHDAGRPKEHRLETWRLAFPPGSTEGNVREVPVERLIRKALEPLSAKCIAHGNGGACEGRIGGWKVQNCERTIQELIKQEIYSDDAKLEFLLKVLEWNRTCNIHQSSEQFTWVVAWKRNIMAVLPLPIPRSDQTVVSNAPNEPQPSSRAQPDPRIVKTSLTGKRAVPITQAIAQVSPNPQAPPCPTISPGVDPALYWPKAYDLSRFNILPHANEDTSPKHSHKLIRAEISRLLDARDLRNGYVYSYEVEGNEGYVKIGYTTRTLKQRHDDWSFDCNRQTKPLYPSPAQVATAISNAEGAAAAPAVLIPHARRVEALCHAELDHRRIRIYCNACLKQHIEWFEVSAIEVTAVIQKWSRWVSTQPYELLQLRSKSKWKLKAIEVQRTSKFEQFMREIAVVPASP